MILKPNDKKLVIDFEELVDIIRGSTPVDKWESAGDKRKRIEFLLSDFRAFCKYYFPEYCFAEFADFHISVPSDTMALYNAIWLWQFSRGFGKTTLACLFMPMFMKFNGWLTGMIVGSHEETAAAEKLADIQANLQGNQRLINDFGEQESWGNWEDGMFKTKDEVAFYAFGKRQSPRGTKFKWKRPNYGVPDDLNVARYLNNESIAADDKAWVMEELKPALWMKKWWIVIPQNKFHRNTVTALIEADEEIKCHVRQVNLEDANGNSNWPQYITQQDIADIKDTEGLASYSRERMNTPVEEGTVFKAEWLQWGEPLKYGEYDTLLIHYLDPSYKSTDKSDYKAWVLIAKKGLAYHVLKAWIEKATSKTMWEVAYEVDEWVGQTAMVKHAMEAGFIQEDVHDKELQRVAKDKGRMLRLQMDRRDKPDKYQRIESMQPLFQRGLVIFNINEKNNPGMIRLRNQLLAIERGSRVNDDGPDALEGAIWMADNYGGKEARAARGGQFKKNDKRSI